MSEVTEDAVRSALREVVDPEVGINIVDLGLVYGVRILPGAIEVDLTMTSPACPMGEAIMDEARDTLQAIAGGQCAIRLSLVWEPPWNPAMMSARAKRTFDWK
jgi:metal-sulfur cluster biosynthetic enzyme